MSEYKRTYIIKMELPHLSSFTPLCFSRLGRQAVKSVSLSQAIAPLAGVVATIWVATMGGCSSPLLLGAVFAATTLVTRGISQLLYPVKPARRLFLQNSVITSNSGLSGLPDDILKCLAKLLSVSDLAALGCTSRMWAQRICGDKKEYHEKDIQIRNASLLELERVREIFYRFGDYSKTRGEHTKRNPITNIKYKQLIDIEKRCDVEIFPASFIRHYAFNHHQHVDKRINKIGHFFIILLNVGLRERAYNIYKIFPCLSSLKCMKQMPNLQTLLAFPAICDGDLVALKAVSHLEHLRLPLNRLTDQGIARLTFLTALKTLNISCSHWITDKGVYYLREFPGLQQLSLFDSCSISDAALSALTTLKMLQKLDLSHCNITDVGVQTLSACTMLDTLKLERCRRITDEGMKHFTLFKLKALDLSSCNITDRGVQALSDCTTLEVLSLRFCVLITDAACSHLEALPAFTAVDLTRSMVSEAVWSKWLDRGQQPTESAESKESGQQRLTFGCPRIQLD